MKIEEIFPKTGINTKKAKALRAKAKEKAKSNNPGDTEDRAGWGADAHQGSFDRMRMTR
jgi:hypothetical protein